jgi:hypothetical protein
MKTLLLILFVLCFWKAECQTVYGSMHYTEKTLDNVKTNIDEYFNESNTWLNGCSDFYFKNLVLDGSETNVTILIKISGKVVYRKVTNIEGPFTITLKEVNPLQNGCKIYVIKDKQTILYHEIGISGCN